MSLRQDVNPVDELVLPAPAPSSKVRRGSGSRRREGCVIPIRTLSTQFFSESEDAIRNLSSWDHHITQLFSVVSCQHDTVPWLVSIIGRCDYKRPVRIR